MKGFIIKNTKTGKVYTGKVEYVDNPDYDAAGNWAEEYGSRGYGVWGGFTFSTNGTITTTSPPVPTFKSITDEDKQRWPIFYKKSAWSGSMEEYSTPFGSDGTFGPPWKKKVANYWGQEPKVFTTKKAAQKILSTITQTYYKDRENETTALLYLPDSVHNYKIVAVEVIIQEIEDGTGIATTSSEPTNT